MTGTRNVSMPSEGRIVHMSSRRCPSPNPTPNCGRSRPEGSTTSPTLLSHSCSCRTAGHEDPPARSCVHGRHGQASDVHAVPRGSAKKGVCGARRRSAEDHPGPCRQWCGSARLPRRAVGRRSVQHRRPDSVPAQRGRCHSLARMGYDQVVIEAWRRTKRWCRQVGLKVKSMFKREDFAKLFLVNTCSRTGPTTCRGSSRCSASRPQHLIRPANRRLRRARGSVLQPDFSYLAAIGRCAHRFSPCWAATIFDTSSPGVRV